MGLRKIKNILIILIAALLLSAVSLAIIGNIGKRENDNSSAASKIYSIYDLDDLKQLRDSCTRDNSYYRGETVNLYADIDMGNESWEPINYFCGTFNGKGHTIYNYAGSGGIFGTFGYNPSSGGTTGSTLKNLNVIANNAAQGIVATNEGIIQNCSISGTISAKSDNVGGIAGAFTNLKSSSILSCQNLADIYANGYSFIGGIAGKRNSSGRNPPNAEICGCINYGSIYNGDNYIGGICGGASGLSRTQYINNINVGEINGSGNYVDDILGRLYNGTNEKNYSLNSANEVRNYISNSSYWNTNYTSFSSSEWGNFNSSSNTNNGYPYLLISALTVTVRVNNSSYGNTGSFQIIKGDSIASSGSSIRVNSSYNVYSASPKSSTNEYTYSFRWHTVRCSVC